ncbi:helix-turn-helix domain-containing protein [Bradyrhizobium sp. USDA 3650]
MSDSVRQIHAQRGPFANWQHAWAQVFDVVEDPDEVATFRGHLTSYPANQSVLTESSSSPVRLRRTTETIAQNRLDHLALRLVLSGSVAGVVGQQIVEARGGDVFFVDLSQTLDLRVSAREKTTTEITLWVPRARVPASLIEDLDLHGMLLRGTTPVGAIAGSALRALAEWAGKMTSQEMDALSNGTFELVARAIGPLLHKARPTGATPLVSFVTIRRYIDRNLTTATLNPDMVAKSFGLSRASLARLFEPVGGVASYIRAARLKRAYQEITALGLSDRRIGQIAFGLGYQNISAFNRLFQKAYGLSPREARKRMADTSPIRRALQNEPGLLARLLAETNNSLRPR